MQLKWQDPTTHRIWLPTAFLLAVVILLIVIPNPYSQLIFPNTQSVPVTILQTDESSIKQTGIIQQGEQTCLVKVDKGRFKGIVANGINLLQGNLESDKLYAVGDRAFAVIDYTDAGIHHISLVDHYRLNWILWLAVIFVVTLTAFAGAIGLRSLLSFILTVLAIWKVLIPAFLSGHNPLIIGLIITIFLTIAIIMLVYGIDKRSLAAITGSILGTLLTALLSVVMVDVFKIHGAVMPFSESLLYAGYAHLNLTQIFTASIFIACSGAMMDVAVDITSAVDEVVRNAENISRFDAIKSGLNVGRAVMGTMTTTLLLAYSGGFISLLMVFMAQGTPLLNILNLKYVSSEILHTLIGSFGLITVAPFTAIASGLLLGSKAPRQ